MVFFWWPYSISFSKYCDFRCLYCLYSHTYERKWNVKANTDFITMILKRLDKNIEFWRLGEICLHFLWLELTTFIRHFARVPVGGIFQNLFEGGETRQGWLMKQENDILFCPSQHPSWLLKTSLFSFLIYPSRKITYTVIFNLAFSPFLRLVFFSLKPFS